MSSRIAGISSMATRLILAELARRHQARTGVAVEIEAMGGVDAARIVREGRRTDVVVLASGPMAKLEAEGCLVAGGVRGFARSGMAVAVRAGADRPDISDEAAVRRAVGSGLRVGYSTGPSGDHLLKLIEGWGLGDLGDRLVKAPPGVPVGALVARGDADLGFQQLSELINEAGVEVLGPLPPAIQATTVFAAGVAATAASPDEARDFIAYIASPETAEVKRAQGMEPAG